MSQDQKITQLVINETRRRLIEESLPRIEKCLGLLSLDQIWNSENSNTNSVGNLVLHLCGNIRQWIVAGLGHMPDTRKRSIEFSFDDKMSKSDLISKFQNVLKEVELVLQKVTPDDLSQIHDVQMYQETGVSILMHVVEHCSYHVGQITYITKHRLDVDTQYYTEALE